MATRPERTRQGVQHLQQQPIQSTQYNGQQQQQQQHVLPNMPSAQKAHFNTTSFRLLQKQQDFLEDAISEEEQKHAFTLQSEPISSPHELAKVQAHLAKLDDCASELVQVVDSYAPRVAKMVQTVWARQRSLVARLKLSLKHHMTEAHRLQGNQDALDERNERLTNQTRRSLGIMNSDVQKLETELIQSESKLNVATKMNESLQSELTRLREQMVSVTSKATADSSFYDLNHEFEQGLNMTEESMARNEAHLNHLNDVFEHFEIKCLEAVISQEQVLKVTTSTQTEKILSKDTGGGNQAELAPIPIVEPEPGLHIPKGLREHMAAFPTSNRIMSQQAMEKVVLRIFLHKVSEDKVHRRKGQGIRDMSSHAYNFLSDTYGLQSLTDPHIAEFVNSLRNFKDKSFYATCMGNLLGCFSEPNDEPPYDIRVDNFLMSALDAIVEQHSSKGSSQATIVKEGNIILSIGHLVADALFKGAPQETLHEMFGALNALDVVVSEGSGKIEKVKLDSFLNILLDTWLGLDERWHKYLHQVYNEHAKFFYDINGFMVETEDTKQSRDGAKFHAVCSFPKFCEILERLNPTIPDTLCRTIFDQALEYLHELRTEEHEKLWVEYLDPDTNRHFYYCALTNESYWARPQLEVFEVGEITLPAFLFVARRHRLGSPLHKWGTDGDDE